MSVGWSGRRGSNPRPTAWKAVTLPLSYSRLRARARPLFLRTKLSLPFTSLARRPTDSRACERRVVAREGLEPSKPLGRQIYSLLRLTASLPRQLSEVNVVSNVPRRSARRVELAKGFEPPTC